MNGFRSTGRDEWRYRQGGRRWKINTTKQQAIFSSALWWERKHQDQQKGDYFLANYSLKSSQKLYYSNFHSSTRFVKCWCRNPLQSSGRLLAELSKHTFQTAMAVPALHHPACPARLWADAPVLSFPSSCPDDLGQSAQLCHWDLICVLRQDRSPSNASAGIRQSPYAWVFRGFYFSMQSSPHAWKAPHLVSARLLLLVWHPLFTKQTECSF